jgi:hypothetical protein
MPHEIGKFGAVVAIINVLQTRLQLVRRDSHPIFTLRLSPSAIVLVWIEFMADRLSALRLPNTICCNVGTSIAAKLSMDVNVRDTVCERNGYQCLPELLEVIAMLTHSAMRGDTFRRPAFDPDVWRRPVELKGHTPTPDAKLPDGCEAPISPHCKSRVGAHRRPLYFVSFNREACYDRSGRRGQ